MANHCSCSINFYGNDMSKIKSMIAEAIEVNKTEGWLPESIDMNKLDYVHYIFDVDVTDECEKNISINCWTKWAPPILELEQICKEADVSCTCWYDEPGMGIYGQSEFDIKTGYTSDISLDDEDLARVRYDDELDQFFFDGESVDSDIIAYQEILDDKLFKSN